MSALPALSSDQLHHLDREGFVVVPSVVPPALCQSAIEAILAFTGVDTSNRETWYQDRFAGHGIVPLHHHQAFWDIRQHPRVYEAFAAAYESRALWVSMDRASYKPPFAPHTENWALEPLHWDCDPWSPPARSLQGLVYLTDTEAEQGAFTCAPVVFRHLDQWREDHQADPDRHRPKVAEEHLVRVAGSAGSLVIFNRLLPHTSSLNRSNTHRFVQYVTMQPAGDEAAAAQRIREWREKLPPAWAIRQKVPGQQVPEPGAPARLSELGDKLVGVKPWDGVQ